MAEPVRILHLEDNPSDALLINRFLRKGNLSCEIDLAEDENSFHMALNRGAYDLILSDYRLPLFDGDQALQLAREKFPDIPFIMLTGELGEDRAVETLKRGATDYILKDNLTRLIPAIRRALEETAAHRKHREAEQHLARMNALWKAARDASNDVVILLDEQYNIRACNIAAQKLYDYCDEELLRMNLSDLRTPEWRHSIDEDMKEAFETGGFFREIDHLDRHGRVIPVEISSKSFTDDGKTFFVHSIRNITERRESEAAIRQHQKQLQEEHELLETIQNNIPLMIDYFDNQTNFYYVNRQWQDVFGWTAEKLLELGTDRFFEEILPDPAYRKTVRTQMRNSPFIWRDVLVTIGEVTREHSWMEIPLGSGRNIGIGIDVTDRRRAERQLAEQKNLFRQIADTIPVMIWLSGLDGKYEYVNQRWLDFTGRSSEEELGDGWMQNVHPEDREHHRHIYESSLAERAEYRTELRLKNRAGEYRWILDHGVPRLGTNNRFAGFIGYAFDITDWKLAPSTSVM